MIELKLIHYVYLLLIAAIITTMCFKKDVVLPSILGIGIIGYMATGKLLSTIQILYRAIYVAGMEFIEIVIIISLVNTMSKALKAAGADELMIKPIRKLMVNSTRAFFVLGTTIMIMSWLIWPTPAIAFAGAIMIPAAVKAGLSPIWTAVTISIFSNGMGLSGDFFIQGAPGITAKTAGIEDPFRIIWASLPIWAAMGITVSVAVFFLMNKERKKNNTSKEIEEENHEIVQRGVGTKFLSIIVPALFILDIILMYLYRLRGGEVTALIGGTAIIIIILAVIIQYGFKKSFGEITGLVREGAMFGIKVFAPIIIIGAFFFLGSRETASEILRMETAGYLTDIGTFISMRIPLTKVNIVLMQTVVSAMMGVGGSGFSGLPLVGTLAQVFSANLQVSKEVLAALGQIITIWVGGGTIIPWSVAPIAAMCDVQPLDIVRKNIIPVTIGILVTMAIGIIMV
jgi:hypothetical protein